MERESFEDDVVATVLNDKFVSIKVDREERPDIDAIYMDAVQALSGHGGWPMSVFLTHTGEPFHGGTYYPRQRFVELLLRIAAVWDEGRERVEEQGQALGRALRDRSHLERAGNLGDELFGAFVSAWRASFDPVFGGRHGRPKFPPAADMRVLLRIHRRGGVHDALQIVRTTLDCMARGGIYDHIGGGFARYSTDERWLVPHFEKMLYDQAALVQAYLEAWQATGNEEYALVVRETCDYVLRDMTHTEGPFYSAEDADSEGEEGRFYVWTLDELKRELGERALRELEREFALTESGNFEHGANVLELKTGASRSARSPLVRSALDKLLEVRASRIRPHLDDKILSDWNGLMIAALARAGRHLGERRYVDAASRAARFLLSRASDAEGRLLHRYRDGQAAIPAFLEDYAYLIAGLIELYQSDFDPHWVWEAVRLQGWQDSLFRDRDSGDYLSTDGSDETVLARRVEPFDNVRPAGRSVTALNLLRLAALTLDRSLADRASQVFASTPSLIRRAPQAFADLLLALDYAGDRAKEIALVGRADDESMRAMLDELRCGFLPNVVVAAGSSGPIDPDGSGRDDCSVPLLRGKALLDGKATAYVCEEGACQAPLNDPERVGRAAQTMRPLPPG
jgi:uncharacterized protein YyaL (SSP411 family)